MLIYLLLLTTTTTHRPPDHRSTIHHPPTTTATLGLTLLFAPPLLNSDPTFFSVDTPVLVSSARAGPSSSKLFFHRLGDSAAGALCSAWNSCRTYLGREQ